MFTYPARAKAAAIGAVCQISVSMDLGCARFGDKNPRYLTEDLVGVSMATVLRQYSQVADHGESCVLRWNAEAGHLAGPRLGDAPPGPLPAHALAVEQDVLTSLCLRA